MSNRLSISGTRLHPNLLVSLPSFATDEVRGCIVYSIHSTGWPQTGFKRGQP